MHTSKDLEKVLTDFESARTEQLKVARTLHEVNKMISTLEAQARGREEDSKCLVSEKQRLEQNYVIIEKEKKSLERELQTVASKLVNTEIEQCSAQKTLDEANEKISILRIQLDHEVRGWEEDNDRLASWKHILQQKYGCLEKEKKDLECKTRLLQEKLQTAFNDLESAKIWRLEIEEVSTLKNALQQEKTEREITEKEKKDLESKTQSFQEELNRYLLILKAQIRRDLKLRKLCMKQMQVSTLKTELQQEKTEKEIIEKEKKDLESKTQSLQEELKQVLIHIESANTQRNEIEKTLHKTKEKVSMLKTTSAGKDGTRAR